MHIEEVDPRALGDATAAGVADILTAAAAHDVPGSRPAHPDSVRLRKRYGWGDDGRVGWMAVAHDRDRLVGTVAVMLPARDNLHLAYVWTTVHPDARRDGVGGDLLERAESWAVARGRRTVTGFAVRDGPGAAFAASRGYTSGLDNALRTLALHDSPTPWSDLRDASLSPDHELVRMAGATDESLLPDLVPVYEGISDAPTGEIDVQPETYDVQTVRSYEQAMLARSQRMYRVLARRRRDGAWGGHTIAVVDAFVDAWAFQEDTAVLAAHRGHRLGLAMKADLYAWLSESEPQVRQVLTFNAESNAHMLAINEAMGFELVARSVQVQRKL
ncbi:MAG: GNAT family N-acetyltransferase [Actinomycetota bacterium]|nr:GNAT family N-acetyltransferase [Actinomycetota bacterium]